MGFSNEIVVDMETGVEIVVGTRVLLEETAIVAKLYSWQQCRMCSIIWGWRVVNIRIISEERISYLITIITLNTTKSHSCTLLSWLAQGLGEANHATTSLTNLVSPMTWLPPTPSPLGLDIWLKCQSFLFFHSLIFSGLSWWTEKMNILILFPRNMQICLVPGSVLFGSLGVCLIIAG